MVDSADDFSTVVCNVEGNGGVLFGSHGQLDTAATLVVVSKTASEQLRCQSQSGALFLICQRLGGGRAWDGRG